jgi:hypothetical protein
MGYATESVDSVRALNQISILTETNKRLESELEASKVNLKNNIAIHLTKEAKTLIEIASSDHNGMLLFSKRPPRQIMVSGQTFPIDKNPRQLAIWQDAFTELIAKDLIRDNNTPTYLHNTYILTGLGYKVADELSSKNIKAHSKEG